MKTKEEIISGLEEHKSENSSNWRKNAEWRLKNKSWMRYSQQIAMMILDRMEELGLTQRTLAERIGCSQQYISRVLKGRENLSIGTLAKFEGALEMQILERSFVQR